MGGGARVWPASMVVVAVLGGAWSTFGGIVDQDVGTTTSSYDDGFDEPADSGTDADTTGGQDSGRRSREPVPPGEYGSDPYLDGLYDDCRNGDNDACDLLYWAAAAGSEYGTFADTCGGRESSRRGRCSGPVPTIDPPAPTTPAAPPTVGLIDISAVNTDDRAVGIATTMNDYFIGINTRDWDLAVSAFAANDDAPVNPTKPGEVAEWSAGLVTTNDSDIVVRRIYAGPGGSDTVRAEIGFTSTQAAVYGRDDQTCSRWLIEYSFVYRGGAWRIQSTDGLRDPIAC